jgi:hypothetical protein
MEVVRAHGRGKLRPRRRPAGLGGRTTHGAVAEGQGENRWRTVFGSALVLPFFQMEKSTTAMMWRHGVFIRFSIEACNLSIRLST